MLGCTGHPRGRKRPNRLLQIDKARQAPPPRRLGLKWRQSNQQPRPSRRVSRLFGTILFRLSRTSYSGFESHKIVPSGGGKSDACVAFINLWGEGRRVLPMGKLWERVPWRADRLRLSSPPTSRP